MVQRGQLISVSPPSSRSGAIRDVCLAQTPAGEEEEQKEEEEDRPGGQASPGDASWTGGHSGTAATTSASARRSPAST